MTRIVISEGDDLNRVSWVYYVKIGYGVGHVNAHLKDYLVERRDTKRHRFKMVRAESYLSDDTRYNTLSAEDVPVPEWLANAVREEISSFIVVKGLRE